MFKAIHAETGKDIISIDPSWADRIDLLRLLDRQNKLLCQECREPVRLKAGDEKVRHFAHKHLKNCSLANVSPEVLMVRALVYARLVQEFGDHTTLEKAWTISRPIDCFVDTASGGIAYWVIDRGIKREDRSVLEEGMKGIATHVHWIFASSMRKPLQENPSALSLTTTERALMAQSSLDVEIKNGDLVRGKSLQYVDHKAAILDTHRSLELVHAPQVYSSKPKMSPLADVLIAPKTGEFAHTGEHEQFLVVKAEWDRVKIPKRIAAEKEATRLRIAQQAEAERQAWIAKEKAELHADLAAMAARASSLRSRSD